MHIYFKLFVRVKIGSNLHNRQTIKHVQLRTIRYCGNHRILDQTTDANDMTTITEKLAQILLKSHSNEQFLNLI